LVSLLFSSLFQVHVFLAYQVQRPVSHRGQVRIRQPQGQGEGEGYAEEGKEEEV
jgi:hypothetical protein